MELNPQIIKKNGINEFVVLPYVDYLKMKEALDDYEDLMDLRKAKADSIGEPTIPYSEVLKKIKKKK